MISINNIIKANLNSGREGRNSEMIRYSSTFGSNGG
jgi:hypothetical protein